MPVPPEHKPGILRNLRIKRVALVDNGANFDKSTGDGAHVMLYKSSPSVGDVHVNVPMGDDDQDEYEKATLDAESRNSLPDSAFAAVWTDAKGVKRRKLPIHDAGHLAAARGRIDMADIPADVKAAARRKIESATRSHSTKEKGVKKSMFKQMLGLFAVQDPTERESVIKELEKAFPDDLKDDKGDDKPMHKADDPMCKCDSCVSMRASKLDKADDAMQKRFDAVEAENRELRKRADEAHELVRAEIAKRERGEVVAVLKSFNHISIDVEKETDSYVAIRKADPKAFDSIMAKFAATDAQLAESVLYKNLGTGRSGGGNSGAWEEIEAKADAMVEKSNDPEFTREMAIEKVMLANPKLVAKYRAQTQ